MTTNKALYLSKASRKDRKDRKDKKHVKKDKKRRTRRYKRNKTITSSLSDLYTYESPVTNKDNSTINMNDNINNVNVVDGLKDFLAVKK